MRTLIISAITCLLMASCQNDGVKNGWTEANLKGKVKSFEESRYDAEERFGKIEKGNLHRWEFYKYDEQGNIIEFRYNSDYGSGEVNWVYKYDEQGNMIEASRHHSDGSLIKGEVYKYDEQGNMIESQEYYWNGSLSSKATYKYDEQGNQIERTWHNDDGSILRKWIYEYDEQAYSIQNKKRGFYHFGENTVDLTVILGNMIEMNQYNSDGSPQWKWVFEYDEQGNMIQTNWYTSDGSPFYKWVYKYDEQGNMIEASKYNLYESPDFKVVYEYDSRDNWIKKIRYNTRRIDPSTVGNMGDTTKPEIPYSIWEREYEYYD
jgi:hypothetical protein